MMSFFGVQNWPHLPDHKKAWPGGGGWLKVFFSRTDICPNLRWLLSYSENGLYDNMGSFIIIGSSDHDFTRYLTCDQYIGLWIRSGHCSELEIRLFELFLSLENQSHLVVWICMSSWKLWIIQYSYSSHIG